jgi:hypothetical protein
MTTAERDARALIAAGCLEKCTDFTYDGKPVLASRLGYRITTRFVRVYFGRVFNHPHVVFTDEMLKPELQGMDVFVDGMDNICATHKRVAESYFSDGGVNLACPPLKALLHIMAYGQFEGKNLDSPEIRALFNRDNLLVSPWYKERLNAKQKIETNLWKRHITYLEAYLDRPSYTDTVVKLNLEGRLTHARSQLKEVMSPAYREKLEGTLGVQPLG